VRFWDSSAIVPLVVAEVTTSAAQAEFERGPEIVAWWAAPVDCLSALARRERDGEHDGAGMSAAIGRLTELARSWTEIQPQASIRDIAKRLLRVHALTAADALQLAAAIAAAGGQPGSLALVTLDDRLAAAAEREGFPVVVPAP
jgi:predicted nucleic acid-binding protein